MAGKSEQPSVKVRPVMVDITGTLLWTLALAII